MSDPSWLQPAPGQELAPDWLLPSAGPQADTSHAQYKAVIARGGALRPFGSSSKVAIAASAAAAAAEAARAAANLLSTSPATPTKSRKGTPTASAKKHAKPSSTDRCAASSKEDSSVLCSENRSDDAEVAPAAVVHTEKHEAVKKTRPYAPRGTASTFQGKRPPKDPEFLKKFLKLRG